MIMEWISIKDRLPEDQEPVLLCGDMPPYVDKWMCIGIWFKPREQFEDCNDRGNIALSHVTHWMELPEYPLNK